MSERRQKEIANAVRITNAHPLSFHVIALPLVEILSWDQYECF